MKPDILEIFRTFWRYLGKNFELFRKKKKKKSAISGNILMIMNLYSAKTIEEYPNALYIKLKLMNK